MRRFLLTTALVLLGQAALADDLALVIGSDRYATFDRVQRGADVTTATAGISALGFGVTALRDATAADVRGELTKFMEALPEAERALVVLSGRFVHDGDRTWYLPANAAAVDLFTVNAIGVSVDSLMTLLETKPGKAVLVLAHAPDDTTDHGPYLRAGIGDLDIGQGVTVLRGDPRYVTDFLKDSLSRPQGDLPQLVADQGRLQAEGYWPAGFTFMPAPPEIAPAPPPTEQPAANTAAEDDALWRRSVAQDNVDAYRAYLRAYPNGRHTSEAEAAIAAILAEPFRADRLAEEALSLTRDQRRDIQGDLTTMGFDTRGVDGIFGAGSRRAVTNWQQENGFAQTGYLTNEQINRLDAQAARRTAERAAEQERQRQEAERLDRAYWDETGARGDETGLRTYLERYPEGVFAATARSELQRITDQGRQQVAERDRAAWNAARDRDNVGAYRQYLRDFPQGTFVADANARITALTGNETVTPTPPPAENTQDNAALERAERALGVNALTGRLVEQRLAALGHNPGPVDGTFDGDTRRAIRAYQQSAGVRATGYLDETTLLNLVAGALGGG